MAFRRGAHSRPGFSNNRSAGGRQVNPWIAGNSGENSRGNFPDPQTQLALASNLLNNLLNPAHQSSPPSLLSLANFGGLQHLGGGGGPLGNMNQGNFGRDRFNQPMRNASRDFGRRDNYKGKRNGGNQGYNKNQGRNKSNEKIKNRKGTDEKKAEKVNETNQQLESSYIVMEEYAAEAGQSDEQVPKEDMKENEEGDNSIVDENEEVVETLEDFAKVAPCLLYCHICRKHMWDAESFVKHLDGRPHKMMINELDQTYKLTVELLRHETRVMEQQRENDIQRAHRKGKTGLKMQQRGFCTMCDLNFLGTLPAHRRNDRHQRLKKFLHPKCGMCDKEFYTRLEWDDHKLTATHLKKLEEARMEIRPHLGILEFDVVDFIEDVNDGIIAYDPEIKVDGVRNTFTEEEKRRILSSLEDQDESMNEEKDDTKYPKYVSGTPMGDEFTVPQCGFLCRACYRFMPTEEDRKVHLQTLSHYNSVVGLLKMRDRIYPKPADNSKVDETANPEESVVSQEGDLDGVPAAKRIKVGEPAAKRIKVGDEIAPPPSQPDAPTTTPVVDSEEKQDEKEDEKSDVDTKLEVDMETDQSGVKTPNGATDAVNVNVTPTGATDAVNVNVTPTGATDAVNVKVTPNGTADAVNVKVTPNGTADTVEVKQSPTKYVKKPTTPRGGRGGGSGVGPVRRGRSKY